MPNGNQQRNLTDLMAEGMSIYPRGMGAMPPRRFLSTSQSTIAGLGNRTGGGYAGTYAAKSRPPFIEGRRAGTEVILNARQGAWGVGRSTRAPSKAERARNRQRFVQMMKKTHPRLYAIAKQRIGDPPAGMAGLGQEKTTTDDRSWFDKFTDTIANLAPTYLTYTAQKELLNIQLARAESGLPPLETAQYTPALQIGLDPEQTRAALAQAGGAAVDFMKSPAFMIAAGGLLLVLVMRK